MYSCFCYWCLAVNPDEIKTLLANSLITFFINGNPLFSNGPGSLPIFEKSKTVSFAFSGMKKNKYTGARSKFSVKLICWIAVGSASTASCLLRPIAIVL